MRLYLFEKYDDFIWERAFSVLRLGGYWLFQFAVYQTGKQWGVETNFCPSYPVIQDVAKVKVYLGNVGFHISFLSRIYEMCEHCKQSDEEKS